MKKTQQQNKTLHQRWFPRGVLVMLAGLALAACDTVPTENSQNVAPTNRVLDYTGPSCGIGGIQDVCTFKVEFWNKMSTTQCTNCHDSQSSTTQSPFFMESSDVNVAYTEALKIVNLDALRVATADPSVPQEIVDKIAGVHNCGDAGACAAMASVVLDYITNWANGGSATSGGEANNTIVLTPPDIRDTGTSRSFPTGLTRATDQGINGSSFANTIWPLLNNNCSDCHQESSQTPQAPFFAEDNIEAAYDAVVSSQKINLDDPAVSRLVVRLNPELHNCWDPNSTGGADCPASSAAMLAAITQFRDGILLTQVNPLWITSKALDLTDGILASGGARDDSSTIALYEMKTGSGNTLYDTSGVEPALNLSLSGNEDIDFKWVGGWGVEFISGRAQGSAQNTKLRDQIVSSGAYSIEAWVVPANVNQGTAGDPARIISYSAGTTTRNFTLGQAEYRYEFMNRNENSDTNGQASFITDDADEDLQASQQHVVVTYDPVVGRKIYVNGVDVSTTGNADMDPATPLGGSLTNWDDSYAFILGSEAGGTDQWAGKLRLVAIHNRAMDATQIKKNFDAGVGEKFYLMFSVSDLIDTPTTPPSDSNCFQTSAVTISNPRGDQCFIYMEVSQFDSYSYLFYQPIFVSKNPGFTSSDSIIKGMRIGLNGKEPAVGQAFSNIGNPTPSLTIHDGTGAYDYNVANGNTTDGEQVLSDIGTIIALEKGAGADEFFLSFEQFGAFNDSNAHADAEYVCDVANIATCLTTPANGTPVPDIGLRTFDEINATMAELTGVDRNTTEVKNTFDTIRQQLPPVETIDGFVSANQMAIAQLAIQYCDALVESTGLNAGLRDSFFGTGFGFTSNVATAFALSTDKDQIADALYDNIVASRVLGGSKLLANIPDEADVKSELIGPAVTNSDNLFDKLGNVMTNVCNDPDPLINANCDNSQVRTRAVVKALCTSVLGSAAMLIQ